MDLNRADEKRIVAAARKALDPSDDARLVERFLAVARLPHGDPWAVTVQSGLVLGAVRAVLEKASAWEIGSRMRTALTMAPTEERWRVLEGRERLTGATADARRLFRDAPEFGPLMAEYVEAAQALADTLDDTVPNLEFIGCLAEELDRLTGKARRQVEELRADTDGQDIERFVGRLSWELGRRGRRGAVALQEVVARLTDRGDPVSEVAADAFLVASGVLPSAPQVPSPPARGPERLPGELAVGLGDGYGDELSLHDVTTGLRGRMGWGGTEFATYLDRWRWADDALADRGRAVKDVLKVRAAAVARVVDELAFVWKPGAEVPPVGAWTLSATPDVDLAMKYPRLELGDERRWVEALMRLEYHVESSSPGSARDEETLGRDAVTSLRRIAAAEEVYGYWDAVSGGRVRHLGEARDHLHRLPEALVHFDPAQASGHERTAMYTQLVRGMTLYDAAAWIQHWTGVFMEAATYGGQVRGGLPSRAKVEQALATRPGVANEIGPLADGMREVMAGLVQADFAVLHARAAFLVLAGGAPDRETPDPLWSHVADELVRAVAPGGEWRPTPLLAKWMTPALHGVGPVARLDPVGAPGRPPAIEPNSRGLQTLRPQGREQGPHTGFPGAQR